MSHEQLSFPTHPTIKRPETIEDARELILDLFWLPPYGRSLCLLGKYAQKFKDFLNNSSLGRLCNLYGDETVLFIQLTAPVSALVDGPAWDIVIDETEWHFSFQDGSPEIKLRHLWRGKEDASPADWCKPEEFGLISQQESFNLCFASLEIAQKAVELNDEWRDAQSIGGDDDNIKLVKWREGARGWRKANISHDPHP